MTAEWERWLGEDAAKAEIALQTVTRRRGDGEQAQTRLSDARDALALVPGDVETDPLFDFFKDLRTDWRGHRGRERRSATAERHVARVLRGDRASAR